MLTRHQKLSGSLEVVLKLDPAATVLLRTLLARADEILATVKSNTQLEEKIMSLADDILAEATRGTTVGQSVIALVQKLVDQAGGDPAKLAQALAAMKGNDDAVEAAVLANTPQAPPPTP